jgi:putative (di)nucleoside polyphosphate hydrolase
MEGDELLLAEYARFADSFWKNEEVGEKRLNFYITLTTAVLAGVIALVSSDYKNISDDTVRLIVTGALSGVFLFGLTTFFRILQRNRVTDEYKKTLDYIRGELKRRSTNLSDFELPLQRDPPKRFKGGLAETAGVMNCLVLAVILALWWGIGWCWLWVPVPPIILGIIQWILVKKRKKKKNPLTQTFRAGVGAIIRNSKGEVLAFERKDKPGSWQMPQGGIEIGEGPGEAVRREICEETGIEENDLQLISKEPCLLAYELPSEYRSRKTGRGQAQYWFVFNFKGADEGITLGDQAEFSHWKWVAMEDLVAGAVHFRQSLYRELMEHFSHLLQESD